MASLLALSTFLVVAVVVVKGQESGYYRVQAELLQLQDPLGIRHDGKNCDSFDSCDPVIKVYLDTERPLAAFPGSRYISQYVRIFEAANQNEPIINKQISTDVCGAPFIKANLRAYVKDEDNILGMTDDHMSDFDCLFSPTPAADEASAAWSKGEMCTGFNQPGKIKLAFRYRVFRIAQEDCGKHNQLTSGTGASSAALVAAGTPNQPSARIN
ncbi:hypothetical protein BV898_03465 [Hypsibius exemplaris]|uniref:MD-2-related lipid-recognition domain-containing protein n=1 Tax=Hypsibius exemplaris TaxID=2072580 RepID=A0A1W0X5M0_HYPEX|nr:hypothetical protein BV898_03465 [Hypsibius exemplaris]